MITFWQQENNKLIHLEKDELEKDKIPNYAWKVDSYKDYTTFYNSIKEN